MAYSDQIAYYSNLLIAQYRAKPKAVAEIQIYAAAALGAGSFFLGEIFPAFDLDTAVGPQLDILGQWIGLPRTIGDPTPLPWFGFVDATGTLTNKNGLQDATNPATNQNTVFFDVTSSGRQNTALSDTAYRFMLKLKAILNVNDNTLATADELLNLFFGGAIQVTDGKNMTLVYTVYGTPPVPVSVLTPYLPKPMGVSITVQTPSDTLTRVLMDGTTIRVLQDGSTQRITQTA